MLQWHFLYPEGGTIQTQLTSHRYFYQYLSSALRLKGVYVYVMYALVPILKPGSIVCFNISATRFMSGAREAQTKLGTRHTKLTSVTPNKVCSKDIPAEPGIEPSSSSSAGGGLNHYTTGSANIVH